MKVLNDQNQWVGDGQIVDRHCDCVDHIRLGPLPRPTMEEIMRRADELVEFVKKGFEEKP